jgi:hypothetical protein
MERKSMLDGDKRDTFMTETVIKKQTMEKGKSLRVTSARLTMITPREKERESVEEEVIRKRQTLYDKIQFNAPDGYYNHFPIQPGVKFIKSIFTHEKAVDKIEFINKEGKKDVKFVLNLNINIPETYWNDSSEVYYIYNGKFDLTV